MGNINAVAERLLHKVRLSAPLHPFFAARAAGIALVPTPGMLRPAELDAGELHFDDSLPEWREHIADIVCGVVLRQANRMDCAMERHALANLLGLALPAPENDQHAAVVVEQAAHRTG